MVVVFVVVVVVAVTIATAVNDTGAKAKGYGELVGLEGHAEVTLVA